jgi:hypothetical protein
MVFVMVGLFCTYSALAAPVIPSLDGAPVPVCDPGSKGCH